MTKQARAQNRVIPSLLMLGLAGCSSTERFSFNGAADDFCVPKDYVVDGPLWLTSDIVTDDGGFAFRGCGQSYAGDCDIPADISGGTLGPIGNMTSNTWSGYFPATEPHETTVRALRDHTYRVIPDEANPGHRILAVPSRSLGATGVYYWLIAADGEPRLEPSSELLAECDGVNDKRSSGAPEVAYRCSRTVLMKDAVLYYHFWSGTVNTASVSGLDAQIIAGIDKWRCKFRMR